MLLQNLFIGCNYVIKGTDPIDMKRIKCFEVVIIVPESFAKIRTNSWKP